MSITRLNRFSFSACLLLVAALAATAQSPSSTKIVSERPNGTQALTASVPANSIQLFKDKDFRGDMNQTSDLTSQASWSAIQVIGKDNASAIRWNIPRGVIVTLFEKDGGLGRSISLWGSGEIPKTSDWKLNDKITSWAWNYVGGVKDPGEKIKSGKSPRPKYAKAADSVSENSMQLYKDRESKGKMATVQQVTSTPQGAYNEMPKEIGKHVSSARWKLPDGVVVVFSEHANGQGPQVAIWGDGEFEGFNLWEMNDKAAYWAWYDLGEAKPTQ